MTGTQGTSGDDISEESRLMAARVRERAGATVPSPADLAAMTADALGKPGTEMSAAEIRQLAADAIEQAQKVSYLLGQLAGLLDSPAGEP